MTWLLIATALLLAFAAGLAGRSLARAFWRFCADCWAQDDPAPSLPDDRLADGLRLFHHSRYCQVCAADAASDLAFMVPPATSCHDSACGNWGGTMTSSLGRAA